MHPVDILDLNVADNGADGVHGAVHHVCAVGFEGGDVALKLIEGQGPFQCRACLLQKRRRIGYPSNQPINIVAAEGLESDRCCHDICAKTNASMIRAPRSRFDRNRLRQFWGLLISSVTTCHVACAAATPTLARTSNDHCARGMAKANSMMAAA